MGVDQLSPEAIRGTAVREMGERPQMLLSDEAREAIGLPDDCGWFDPIARVWVVCEDDIDRYRPELIARPTITEQENG